MTPTVLATGLGFPEGPVLLDDGGVLVSEMARGRLTRVDASGTRVVVEVGGGPNGLLRWGPHVLVCQNGGASWGTGPWPYDLPGAAQLYRPTGPPEHPVPPQVQRFDGQGDVVTFATTFRAIDGSTRELVRPSDICPDGSDGFYLTDGGDSAGRTRTVTGLLHGDGNGTLREVVFPLEMPNGVALSPDRSFVYVAETRTRRVWRFRQDAPGVIGAGEGFVTVPSGGALNIGGADGLCVDHAGNVVVATLGVGGVTVFDPSGQLVHHVALDDPMTTNVMFDAVRDRIVVTLASTGRVVAIEQWASLVAGVGR